MEPAELLEMYRSKAVLLDTNLLVLLIVGTYKLERVKTFGRTDKYTSEDFALVEHIIKGFRRRITTPHILAEADNLTRQLGQREHGAVAKTMAALVENFFEIYSPSIAAVQHDRYSLLGLTDCATIAVAKDVLVITDDFPLFNILTHLGFDALNINHIRPLVWK